jgi:pre-rRNA-processing protein TSR1
MLTPACPLLIFKQSEVDGSLSLVATGNMSSIDPDRIMLKKIILTGNPIRVRKRSGVVKHMFYDAMVRNQLFSSLLLIKI